jgi:hypothetical protein
MRITIPLSTAAAVLSPTTSANIDLSAELVSYRCVKGNLEAGSLFGYKGQMGNTREQNGFRGFLTIQSQERGRKRFVGFAGKGKPPYGKMEEAG